MSSSRKVFLLLIIAPLVSSTCSNSDTAGSKQPVQEALFETAAVESSPSEALLRETPLEQRAALKSIHEENERYFNAKLSEYGVKPPDGPLFSTLQDDNGFFYMSAVSWKTASERLARTRALEEAQRLLQEYRTKTSGAEEFLGRFIETIEWKILQGSDSEGKLWYLACFLGRVSLGQTGSEL
ncbi:hypothetical protein ACYULU_05320 [Breznakiellaceae bacterium SP9]